MGMDTEDLQNLIASRRTCYLFNPKETMPLKDDAVYRCLNAAIWAPNHKLTQPWRFWVLGAQSQSELAEVYAQLRADKRAQPQSEAHQSIYQAAIEKFHKFPRIVLVGQVLDGDEVRRKEDYAACACAIQNLQLVAWQQGIGVQWSTGPILQSDFTYQMLGESKDKVELIGALYMGYLKGDCNTQNAKRKPVEEVSRWLP